MISDYQLIAMLGLFISIDLLIIIIREIVDPLHADEHFIGSEVSIGPRIFIALAQNTQQFLMM